MIKFMCAFKKVMTDIKLIKLVLNSMINDDKTFFSFFKF